MNKYLRLICLATCLFAIVSCEKNDHPTPKTDITQTIYEPGKEYTRKFYFGSHAIGGYTPETGVHFIYYFFPECTRLGGGFQLHDYDNGVPTADQINKVIDLNSANKNSDEGKTLHGDSLIACLFTFTGYPAAYPPAYYRR